MFYVCFCCSTSAKMCNIRGATGSKHYTISQCYSAGLVPVPYYLSAFYEKPKLHTQYLVRLLDFQVNFLSNYVHTCGKTTLLLLSLDCLTSLLFPCHLFPQISQKQCMGPMQRSSGLNIGRMVQMKRWSFIQLLECGRMLIVYLLAWHAGMELRDRPVNGWLQTCLICCTVA